MKRSMSMSDAFTVARFFARLAEQIERARIYGRERDAYSMCRLRGRLEVSIFGWCESGFDDPLVRKPVSGVSLFP